MEEINASLKKFQFTPNKDFAKKVTTMRKVYEKEENEVIKAVKEQEGKVTEEAKKAYEKAEKAIKQAQKAEEEYNRIRNLPIPKVPWYKKVPVIKQVVNGISKIFNKGENQTVQIDVDEAKAKFEQAMKEAEEATRTSEGKRSTDYLEELRKQKDENVVLEGMTLYGDTFKDRLKYKMPNVKSSLTQDQINKAKSMNKKEYVMPGHEVDKRAYNVDARKAMVRKNIEELKKKNEMKKHDDDERE